MEVHLGFQGALCPFRISACPQYVVSGQIAWKERERKWKVGGLTLRATSISALVNSISLLKTLCSCDSRRRKRKKKKEVETIKNDNNKQVKGKNIRADLGRQGLKHFRHDGENAGVDFHMSMNFQLQLRLSSLLSNDPVQNESR